MTKYFEGKPCIHGHGILRYKIGGACVTCQKENTRRRWAAGMKKYSYDAGAARSRGLKRKYGLSVADYDAMAEAQGNKCLICDSPPAGKHGRFHVDHCHTTGTIRGLLCNKCNVGLGSFRDNPKFLTRAADYLVRI